MLSDRAYSWLLQEPQCLARKGLRDQRYSCRGGPRIGSIVSCKEVVQMLLLYFNPLPEESPNLFRAPNLRYKASVAQICCDSTVRLYMH